MTAKIIGFCRYSVLTDTGQAWQIGKRREWRANKAMLLNPERLERRLVLLEKVMLPSVAGQSVPPEPDWFRLCLLVSDQLPPDAYEALSNVVSRYNWCRIVPVSTKPAALSKCMSESLDEFVDPQSCFASFRLDDDYALGRHYVEQLLSYTHEGHRGHVLTFPSGCKGWFDHAIQAYTRLAGHREPKIALGLAYVGHCQDKIRHVFQLGNHARVDENFPVISLPASPMYLRSFHDDNDVLSVTETDKRAARVDLIFEKGQPMALNQLDEHFALGQGGHCSQEVFIKQWRLRLYTWFDPHWYLRQYPDVAQAGLDPWHHYQSHGVNEGRLPCMVSAMEWDKALWQQDKPRAQCVAELERLANSDNPLEASFAGFALGRWHAWQDEWSRAAACLARRPPGKGVLPNHPGPDLLTVEAFGRSGQLARAWPGKTHEKPGYDAAYSALRVKPNMAI